MSGGDSREVTPVPMPNTEVKFSSADGSWDFVPVRVGRCQATAQKRLVSRLAFFVIPFDKK